MSTYIYATQINGKRLHRIGRLLRDFTSTSEVADGGGAIVGTIRSERISPSGEHGYNLFRRVGIRFRHSSDFTFTVRVYVDGEQTQVWASGEETDQVVVRTVIAPTGDPIETTEEIDIVASGTYIEVEIEITADPASVAGTYLIESVEIHYRSLRPARQQEAST